MDYKISIIIPTYNNNDGLIVSFNSILNQTLSFKKIEVIIVDDYSSDETRNTIKMLDKQYENVKGILLSHNSGSPGKPRNIGVDNSNANYITFLDCGDSYNNTICEEIVNTFDNNDVDLIWFNHNTVYDGFSKHSQHDIKNNEVLNVSSENYIFEDSFIWNKSFKREIILENNIKTIEYNFGEDDYFVLSYLFNIETFIFLKTYGYNYIINSDSVSNAISVESFNLWYSGYFKVIKMIKNKKYTKIYKHWCERYIHVLIIYMSKIDYGEPKEELVDKIFELEKFMNIKPHLPIVTNYINNAIIIKNYKKAIFIINLLYRLQNISLFKKLFRLIR